MPIIKTQGLGRNVFLQEGKCATIAATLSLSKTFIYTRLVSFCAIQQPPVVIHLPQMVTQVYGQTDQEKARGHRFTIN